MQHQKSTILRYAKEYCMVFDEVKVAAKLHWNSRNDALIGHSMTAQEMAILCDLYAKLEKDVEPGNSD